MTVATRTLPWEAINVYQHGGQNGLPIETSFRQSRQTHGLDWEPRKVSIHYEVMDIEGVTTVEMNNYRAIVRSDTQEALGVVGKDYKPFGNSEFVHLMDSLVDVGEAKHAGLGVLKSGKRVYAVVGLNPEQYDLDTNGDRYSPFVYGINGHDGGSSLHLGVTIIRWACTNGLVGVVPGSTHFVKVRHSGNMNRRIAEAQRVLIKAADYIKAFGKHREQLLDIESRGISEWIEPLIPVSEDNGKNARQRQAQKNRQIDLAEFWVHSDNIENFRYTGFGFVNAVAEWDQHGSHKRRTRSEMDRLVDGDSARMVARARELVLN
jgi:phage/plasmid-like protein (TIGR03299 family)